MILEVPIILEKSRKIQLCYALFQKAIIIQGVAKMRNHVKKGKDLYAFETIAKIQNREKINKS